MRFVSCEVNNWSSRCGHNWPCMVRENLIRTLCCQCNPSLDDLVKNEICKILEMLLFVETWEFCVFIVLDSETWFHVEENHRSSHKALIVLYQFQNEAKEFQPLLI